MRNSLLALAAVATLGAGCNRREEAPPPAPAVTEAPPPQTPVPAPVTITGFQHDAAFDASGYFMTETPVTAGTLKLRTVAVGAPSDFSQWEAGSRSVFGPILFDFEDTASGRTVNEIGAEVHTGTVRVLPSAYRFSAGEVFFQGSAPKLGEVVFSGSFDAAALAAARQNGSSDGEAVLTGSLQVGGERIRNISFSYWAGD